MKKLLALSTIALSLTLASCGESNDGLSENTAKSSCKTWVDMQIDSNDAEFQNQYDVMAWPIEGGYRIHGEVSIPNAFGGAIPHVYECKVTQPEGAENPDVVVETIEPK